eukprot:scaffold11320_cov121-Isochrysis_galbana.AAC.6
MQSIEGATLDDASGNSSLIEPPTVPHSRHSLATARHDHDHGTSKGRESNQSGDCGCYKDSRHPLPAPRRRTAGRRGW